MSPEGIVREFELPFRTDPQSLALIGRRQPLRGARSSPTSSVVKAASSIPAADRARPSAATGSFGPSVVSRNVPKCMPMLRRTSDVHMRLHGLLRIHVNVLHEPARFICADRYQRKIDPRKPPANLQEMGTVTAVAREVDLLLVDRDHEAAP